MAASNVNERPIIASIGAHESWSRTPDRAARTAPARRALEEKFLSEAGGDPARAANLRTAYYKRLALKSAQSRRRAKEYTATAEAAEAELDQLGGDAS